MYTLLFVYSYLILGIYLSYKQIHWKNMYLLALLFCSFKVITNYRVCSVAYLECKLRDVKRKESYKVLEVNVCQERSQRVNSTICLSGVTSSSLKRTTASAAGFQLEGNLCHFDKLHNSTQRVISPVPLGDQESEIAEALLAGTSLVLVNAV